MCVPRRARRLTVANCLLARGSTPASCAVTDNHISNFSRVVRTYMPGVAFGGVGQYVARNTLEHGPHCAIQGGGNDNLFEYNNISHVTFECTDTGAFCASSAGLDLSTAPAHSGGFVCLHPACCSRASRASIHPDLLKLPPTCAILSIPQTSVARGLSVATSLASTASTPSDRLRGSPKVRAHKTPST